MAHNKKQRSRKIPELVEKMNQLMGDGYTAIDISLGMDADGIFSVGADPFTGVYFIKGPEEGNIVIAASGAYGLGTLEVGAQGSVFLMYYHGDIKNFTRESLTGFSKEINISVFGYNMGFSRSDPDSYGGYVDTFKVGGGIGALPVSISVRESSTKLYRQFRKK